LLVNNDVSIMLGRSTYAGECALCVIGWLAIIGMTVTV